MRSELRMDRGRTLPDRIPLKRVSNKSDSDPWSNKCHHLVPLSIRGTSLGQHGLKAINVSMIFDHFLTNPLGPAL